MPTAPPAIPRSRHKATSPAPVVSQPLVIHTSASDEFVPRQAIAVRVTRGLARRARRLWRAVTRQQPATLVEDTFTRLRQPARADGLPARLDRTATSDTVSPQATALGISTATRYGEHELAARWAERLGRFQLASGAVVDDSGQQASAFATAAAVRAWCDVVATGGDHSERVDFERAVAAARWLVAHVEPSGRLRIERSGCCYDVVTPDAVHLALVAPLARVAERRPDVVSPAVVRRAVSYYRRTTDPFAPNRIPGGHSLATAALWELGHYDDVIERMFLPSAYQRRDGAMPASPQHRSVLADDVARLARLWLLTGDVDRGNRAVGWLSRRRIMSTAAALARLDAIHEQVPANFLHKRGDVHRSIDPRDGRMQALRDWCAGIGAHSKVADVGCGAGRYSAQLAAQRPALRLTGIDVAINRPVPLSRDVAYEQGQMLDLRNMHGHYDAAFAIESLEHALLPDRAVAEICRLVRPGGKILIMDKDRRRQPLSDHAPWERWFTANEVCHWLAAHCDEVRLTPISHGVAPAREGLFFCWTAVRRREVARQAA